MKEIYFNNSILTTGKKYTFLTNQALAGDNILSVESIVGFSVNQILLVGELNNEKTEIVKTSSSTVPSGTTITLATNLTFPHPVGTKVYIIDWDQLEIYWAETATGPKTLLDTINLQVDQQETQYNDTAHKSGYYFFRLKNSINSLCSDYSDAYPWGGLGKNTVGFVINYALKRNKLNSFTDNIDHDFCIDEINSCLQYITGKLKRWSKLQNFNYILGRTQRGVWSYDLPQDIYESNSNKSILGVRIGTEGTNLQPLNKDDFNELFDGVAHTTCSATPAESTTLTLDNSYDFNAPTSGNATVMVNGMLITYTTNDKETGVLSGIPATGTGSITTDIPEGSDVWQGAREGKPRYFSVWQGKLYIELPDANYANKNIYLDYWREANSVDSDADTLDVQRYDMVKYWLTAAIRWQLQNNGKPDIQDGDFLKFRDVLLDAMRGEINMHKKHMIPKINNIQY